MSGLPRISGRECAKALKEISYSLKRQEASHMILRRDDPFAQVVVPDHKELDRGTVLYVLLFVNQVSVSMNS